MSELSIKEIKSLEYQRPETDKGYANQYVSIDISGSAVDVQPVNQKMKDVFVGGKGFDLWLLWNAVSATTQWNDAENAVCIAAGPLAGTPVYPGSGKSIVTTLSPITGSVIDSKVGGYFGPYLKFAGFDALKIVGKTAGDTVIFIDGLDQKVQIMEAPGLPDDAYQMSDLLTGYFSQGKKGSVSVITTGCGA